MFTIDLSSDEEREGDSRPVYGDQGSIANTLTHPSTDWIRSQSHGIKTVESLSIPAACGLSISCPQQTSHFPPHVSGLDDSRPSTPKSDSELTNQKNPEILWTWGELPQAAQPAFLTDHQKQHPPPVVSIPVSSSTHFRTILDMGPPSLNLYAPQPGEFFFPFSSTSLFLNGCVYSVSLSHHCALYSMKRC
ncbi:phosphatidate phosphatase LPIN1-like [Pseudochaenichthys georgianus]|uniref:phosphatidate phosphatase LPIN1-like n=1 Tax=Pseudochaenichthys georgianus TaxID=52239 RepID=UPI0039C16157